MLSPVARHFSQTSSSTPSSVTKTPALGFDMGQRGKDLARNIILQTPASAWEFSARKSSLHEVYYKERKMGCNLPVYAPSFYIALDDDLRLSVEFSPDAQAANNPHDEYLTPLKLEHRAADRPLLDRDYFISLSVYRPERTNGKPPLVAFEKLQNGEEAREMYWNLFQRSTQEVPDFLDRLVKLIGDSPIYRPVSPSHVQGLAKAYGSFSDAKF